MHRGQLSLDGRNFAIPKTQHPNLWTYNVLDRVAQLGGFVVEKAKLDAERYCLSAFAFRLSDENESLSRQMTAIGFAMGDNSAVPNYFRGLQHSDVCWSQEVPYRKNYLRE